MTTNKKDQDKLNKKLNEENEGGDIKDPENTPPENDPENTPPKENRDTPNEPDVNNDEPSLVDAFLDGDMETVQKMIHDKAVEVVKDELEN